MQASYSLLCLLNFTSDAEKDKISRVAPYLASSLPSDLRILAVRQQVYPITPQETNLKLSKQRISYVLTREVICCNAQSRFEYRALLLVRWRRKKPR